MSGLGASASEVWGPASTTSAIGRGQRYRLGRSGCAARRAARRRTGAARRADLGRAVHTISRRGRARDQSPRPAQVLRRSGGGSGHRPRGRRPRGLRLPGAQRGRQDDHGRDPGGLSWSGAPARSTVLGVDPADAERRWRQRIGIVLQQCNMQPELTVRESLELYAGLLRGAALGRRDDRARRAWRTRPTSGPGACPEASSAAWTSRWRWSATRSSCSSTSRPPGSIPRRGGRPGR